MQIVAMSPSSGRLGGVVFTRGRAGAQITAHRARTQPRTTSQVAGRALTGALASAWRALTPSQQTAWNAIASGALSGVNLFTSCNRNLQTIGAPGILDAPAARPTLPAIDTLTVTPLYNSPTQPRALEAWQLDTTPGLDGTFAAVIRVSQCLSQAKAAIRESDLRVIAGQINMPATAFIPTASWWNLWGNGPSQGVVTFELNVVDTLTGFAGPRVRGSSTYDVTPSSTPGQWTVTFEQEGSAFAQVPDQFFEIGGVPIAGG